MQFVLTLPHKAGHLLSPFALLAFVRNQPKHNKKKMDIAFFRHRQTKKLAIYSPVPPLKYWHWRRPEHYTFVPQHCGKRNSTAKFFSFSLSQTEEEKPCSTSAVFFGGASEGD
jgi:hypothetical protein